MRGVRLGRSGTLITLVRALVLADQRLDGVSNVGTGEQYTFNRIIELLNAELGTAVEPTYVENPFEVYVHDTLADSSTLAAETGWEPEVSFVVHGIGFVLGEDLRRNGVGTRGLVCGGDRTGVCGVRVAPPVHSRLVLAGPTCR